MHESKSCPSRYPQLSARWEHFFRELGFDVERCDSDGTWYLEIFGDLPLVVYPAYVRDLAYAEELKEWGTRNQNEGHIPSDLLLVGETPYRNFFYNVKRTAGKYNWDDHCIGVMRPIEEDLRFTYSGEDPILGSRLWDPVGLAWCDTCFKTSIKSIEQSYIGIPCGHQNADRVGQDMDAPEIEVAWPKDASDYVLERIYYKPNTKSRWKDTPPKHVLYRSFSLNGALLYIGRSNHWGRRMREHELNSPWFDMAGQITIETYQTEAELICAEKVAIQRENPIYNIEHNQRNRY